MPGARANKKKLLACFLKRSCTLLSRVTGLFILLLMARPERNTVDYFPHMIGDGKKMFFIEQRYGNDGYATWYKLLEKLGSTENHYLDLNDQGELMYLAAKCRIEESKLISIISDLSKMGVFDADFWGSKIIWCQQFIDSIQDAYKRRNNKCITFEGLREHLIGLGKLKRGKCEHDVSTKHQSKIEDSKEKREAQVKQELIFPFESENFMKLWGLICQGKKWKNKSVNALQMALKKLSRESEPDACKMLENAIQGDWQGLVELKPHEKTNGTFASKNKQGSASYDVNAINAAHKALKEFGGQ